MLGWKPEQRKKGEAHEAAGGETRAERGRARPKERKRGRGGEAQTEARAEGGAEPGAAGGDTREEGEGRGPESCGRRPERRKEGRCPNELRAGGPSEGDGGRERRRARKERRKRRRPAIEPSADPRRAVSAVRTTRQRLPANEKSWRRGRAQKVRRGERRASRAARAL